jgi:hypothetical protein
MYGRLSNGKPQCLGISHVAAQQWHEPDLLIASGCVREAEKGRRNLARVSETKPVIVSPVQASQGLWPTQDVYTKGGL